MVKLITCNPKPVNTSDSNYQIFLRYLNRHLNHESLGDIAKAFNLPDEESVYKVFLKVKAKLMFKGTDVRKGVLQYWPRVTL